MTEASIKVLEALERHPRLNVLQIASTAEMPISVAKDAVEGLQEQGLLETSNGTKRLRYSLNSDALSEQLAAA